MNHLDEFTGKTVGRRHFLKWAALGLVTLLTGACTTAETPHFTVEITADSTFSPSPLIIPRGATVTWLNRNMEAYTVTCDPAKIADQGRVRLPANAIPWDSGTLYPGEQWTNTFPVAGYFLYSTRLGNPESSTGIVVVIA